MATIPYINPQGLDPYPIESTLASGMMDPAKAGIASVLMAGYQAARQGNANQYGQSVNQAQNLYGQTAAMENRDKSIGHLITLLKNAGENPGMLQAAMGNNLLSPLMQGNSESYNGLNTSSVQAHLAKIAQQYGSGAKSLVEAGYTPSLAYSQGVTGDAGMQQGPPLSMRLAAINAAQAKVPKISWRVDSPDGSGPSATVPLPVNQDPTDTLKAVTGYQRAHNENTITNRLREIEAATSKKFLDELIAKNKGNRAAAIDEAITRNIIPRR